VGWTGNWAATGWTIVGKRVKHPPLSPTALTDALLLLPTRWVSRILAIKSRRLPLVAYQIHIYHQIHIHIHIHIQCFI